MGQTWEWLLFAHWRVPERELRSVVPAELPLDTIDGKVYVAVTPFVVKALRVRGMAPPPLVSSFPEINVRTYVTVDGRPGIYFFSFDADSRFAVETVRRIYRLPYFRAHIDAGAEYASERSDDDGPSARFRAHYRSVGPPRAPSPGSLDHFLTERYCVYTLDDERRILRGEIHHRPWPLQAAEAEIAENTMGEQIGLALDATPLLHYSARQDVVFWQLEPAQPV